MWRKPRCPQMVELSLGLFPPWCGSCELMCCSCWPCFASLITKVSSTYLSHKWGVWGRTKGLDFELFHKQVGNEGANGGIHSSTMDPVCNTYLGKGKYVFWGKTPGVWQFVVWTCWSFGGSIGSCCNFCLTILIEGSTGTDLDIIWCYNLTWLQLYLLDVLHKMLGVFKVVWRLTKGQRMFASSLDTPYVMDPLLDTVGLRRVQTLCMLGRP